MDINAYNKEYTKRLKGGGKDMAVKDYREMYITTILTLGRENRLDNVELTRAYLSTLTLEELKELALKLQG